MEPDLVAENERLKQKIERLQGQIEEMFKLVDIILVRNMGSKSHHAVYFAPKLAGVLLLFMIIVLCYRISAPGSDWFLFFEACYWSALVICTGYIGAYLFSTGSAAFLYGYLKRIVKRSKD